MGAFLCCSHHPQQQQPSRTAVASVFVQPKGDVLNAGTEPQPSPVFARPPRQPTNDGSNPSIEPQPPPVNRNCVHRLQLEPGISVALTFSVSSSSRRFLTAQESVLQHQLYYPVAEDPTWRKNQEAAKSPDLCVFSRNVRSGGLSRRASSDATAAGGDLPTKIEHPK